MRLFWRKGYAATSIADLTAEMGIGSPSLYAAFGSKEALYAEALRRYRDEIEPLIWGRFDVERTARGAVEALLSDTISTLSRVRGSEDPRGCMVALSAAAIEGPAGLGSLLQEARSRGCERLASRLRRAVAEGELTDEMDPEDLARFLMAVLGGLSLLARDGGDPCELAAVARVTMAMWEARTSPKDPRME